MDKIQPTSITADRQQRTLTITWAGGHESGYPFAGLRAACPCVECKGGHEHMGGPPDARLVRDAEGDVNLERVETVGAYALQFFWSDHHNTGIYTWSYLRAACPCPICLPEPG
jgi:DUF971 family protein